MWTSNSNQIRFLGLLLIGCFQFHLTSPQVSLGRFLYNGHGLTGEVILLNDRQYRIRGFSYDGKGPAVWHTGMRRGTAGVYSADAWAFRNEAGSCDRLGKRYSNRDVVITVPRNISISRDLESISVYCWRFCHNFGHVKVPRGLKLARGPQGDYGTCRTGHKGCSRDGTRDNGVCTNNAGRLETCPVSGGGGGNRNRNNNNNNNNNLGNGGRGRRPPSGGRGRFSTGAAGPRRIGRFISYANGVVGDVTILNDKQFRVRGFGYSGARGKNTYFLLMERGVAGVYNVKGWAVPDERGRCGGLRGYRGEDIVVTVPDEINLGRDIGAIAVYDYENCVNFGHVRVPDGLAPVPAYRRGSTNRKVCLPFFRPCSRRDTKNNGVCRGRNGGEATC